ncbi:MAG: aminotransferase class V-fold PLP-dependent enzyme [Flavobacteriales bacterium]|nr:aminotransferase class V-fold PLP-dependent enzyme [Flavobacteriales bacterium]
MAGKPGRCGGLLTDTIICYFCAVSHKTVPTSENTSLLEEWFQPFRDKIIGLHQTFNGPYGEKEILYADWTASGRLYEPIENRMHHQIAPYVANTHTETSTTGSTMTQAYHRALQVIKQHVHADEDDIIISSHSGMTGVVNKFQRILGFRIHERYRDRIKLADNERPLVILTHMEHHSNHTTWLESIAEVVVMDADDQGLVDTRKLEEILEKHKDRPIKIAAVTSCSNVTGIKTPYHKIAAIMHAHGGLCFVDFACSAPYIDINMHPENTAERLDAIYFSPHKFLGGPGSSGILIFNRTLYNNRIPDEPGGGTVAWTNPWGEHRFLENIEAREDGGTPSFLQTIRAALCVRLKEEMTVPKIIAREKELMDIVFPALEAIPNLHILAGHIKDRLGVVSFYIDGLHYNLGVRLLNDKYGIQVRGGCSCAGTYGHYLLHVDVAHSRSITDKINQGDLSEKPGWIRMSIHPTHTKQEVQQILEGIKDIAANFRKYGKDYTYNPHTNEFQHKNDRPGDAPWVQDWFDKPVLD